MKLLTRAVPLVALVGFLVLIGLGGCSATSEGLSDLDSVAADKDALDISYAGTDSVTSVTQALTLPTTGDNGTTITWVSSDTTVIANDGAVTRPAADATVTLTATITKNEASDTKTFTLTVLKDAGLSDTESVAADKDALDISYAGTDSVTSVTQALTLPTTGDNGTTITWVSSDTTVIANDGAVTRPAADATVTLTATITKNEASDTKTFTLTVLKDAGLSDTESVAADKDALDISYAGTDSVTSVTQALTLPTTGDNGTTITWVSSDTTVIANDGAVTRPAADATVTLTATITKNEASDTKTFTLTVLKDAGLSDTESVAAAKTALVITYAQGDSATSVTQDMTLPTTGASGTTISWTSSDTAVNANDGAVTRPDFIGADTSVTLTATITKNSASDTKTFTLTVIKKDQVDITNLDSAAFSLTVANTTVPALTGATHTAMVGGSLSLTAGTDYDLSITGTGVSSGAVSIANDGTITIADSIVVSDGGLYTVKATGKGNYNGEKTANFALTVDAKDITTVTGFDITVGNQTVSSSTGSTFPVTINNAGLTAGTDYELSIEKGGATVAAVTINNDGLVSIAATIVAGDAGTYTVKATGIGNYRAVKQTNFLLTVEVVYSVGDTGPAGGKIFYENANYVTDGWRYLEAAPSDLSVTYKWGDTATSVTTGTAIGTGKSNTAAIVEALDGAGFTEDYAAKACADYSSGGKDDWFLPSKDELNELYKQKNTVGVASNIYWSSSEYTSSEYSASYARGQNFSNGNQSGSYKDTGRHVRAVRAF